MVERSLNLDDIFYSLADPTRRDILRRIADVELSVSEIAKHYDLTFGAISKHLKVLERALLVTKTRRGKEQIVRIAPQALVSAMDYLEWYKPFWNNRLDSLEAFINEEHGNK